MTERRQGLHRQTMARNLRHDAYEEIQFERLRVNDGRDPLPLKILALDRPRPYAIPIEQMLIQPKDILIVQLSRGGARGELSANQFDLWTGVEAP